MSLLDYVGKIIVLEIKRQMPQGLYLGLRHSDESVLLPRVYAKSDDVVGGEIEVFLYTDSEDRLVATTLRPKALLNEIAILEIKDMGKNGLFLDLGLQKDIFMPTKNVNNYKNCKEVAIFLTKDKQNRLIAKKDISKHIKKCNEDLLNKKVEIFTIGISTLGVLTLVLPQFYQGLIYQNEIFQEIKINTRYFATVKNIRRDGKLDLQLVHNLDNFLKAIDLILNKKDHFNIDEILSMDIDLSKKAIKRELSNLISEKKLIFVKGAGYKRL